MVFVKQVEQQSTTKENTLVTALRKLCQAIGRNIQTLDIALKFI